MSTGDGVKETSDQERIEADLEAIRASLINFNQAILNFCEIIRLLRFIAERNHEELKQEIETLKDTVSKLAAPDVMAEAVGTKYRH